MDSVRTRMFNGIKIKECNECYQLEDKGGDSDRIYANEDFKEDYPELFKQMIEGNYQAKAPLVLDLRVGNICNLQCQSCFPDLSHGVYDDYIELNKSDPNLKLQHQINRVLPPGFNLDQIKDVLPNVLQLKLIGGEPILSPYTEELLKYCVNKNYAENMELRLHTNLTTFNIEILQLLKKFNKVFLTFSMDGKGELNDYLRYPSKWNICHENLLKHIEFFKTDTNFSLCLSPVVQLSNITSMGSFLDYLVHELEMHDKGIRLLPITLMTPSYLSPYIAPEEIRELATNLFKKSFNNIPEELKFHYQDLDDTMNTLNQGSLDPNLLKRYFQITDAYDHLRRSAVSKVFKEYEYMKSLIS